MPPSLNDTFRLAIAAHQRGDLEAAEQGFRAVVKASPACSGVNPSPAWNDASSPGSISASAW